MTAPVRRRTLADPSLVGLIHMPGSTTTPLVSLFLRLSVAPGEPRSGSEMS